MFIVSLDIVGNGGDMGYPEREFEKAPHLIDRRGSIFDPVLCRVWLTDEGTSLNLIGSDFRPEKLKNDPHGS